MSFSATILLAAGLLLGSASLGHAQMGGSVVSAVGGGASVQRFTATVFADPIITDFTDRMFEFLGRPSTVYSILDGSDHIVSMRLKEGHMFEDGHVGSYISGMGVSCRDHTFTIELEGDDLKVVVDGEELRVQNGQTQLTHVVPVEGAGDLVLLWDSNREGLGQAVEINSDLLQLLMFVTPAGSIDRGVAQPAYINFNAALLGHPTEDMQGVLGESYARLISGDTLPKDGKFYGNEADYEVEDYFVPLAAPARSNVLRASAGYTVAQRRRMIEAVALSFPLRSQARSSTAVLA